MSSLLRLSSLIFPAAFTLSAACAVACSGGSNADVGGNGPALTSENGESENGGAATENGEEKEASDPSGPDGSTPTPDAGTDAGPTGGTLRVMTYNIKTGSESTLAKVAGVIANEKADIVGLQEVDDETNRSGKVHQTEELSKLSGMPHHYFGSNFAFDGGKYGLAILSRFPLTNPRVIRMDDRTTRGDGYEPRIAVAADVVAYGKKITFITMHASLHTEERGLNASRVLAALPAGHAPAIIVGDMNETPGATIGDAFVAAGYIDAHKQKDGNPLSGLTSPAIFPVKRIDMIYKEGPFGATRFTWVPSTTASDHRPVMATFDTPK